MQCVQGGLQRRAHQVNTHHHRYTLLALTCSASRAACSAAYIASRPQRLGSTTPCSGCSSAARRGRSAAGCRARTQVWQQIQQGRRRTGHQDAAVHKQCYACQQAANDAQRPLHTKASTLRRGGAGFADGCRQAMVLRVMVGSWMSYAVQHLQLLQLFKSCRRHRREWRPLRRRRRLGPAAPTVSRSSTALAAGTLQHVLLAGSGWERCLHIPVRAISCTCCLCRHHRHESRPL